MKGKTKETKKSKREAVELSHSQLVSLEIRKENDEGLFSNEENKGVSEDIGDIININNKPMEIENENSGLPWLTLSRPQVEEPKNLMAAPDQKISEEKEPRGNEPQRKFRLKSNKGHASPSVSLKKNFSRPQLKESFPSKPTLKGQDNHSCIFSRFFS